MNVSNCCSAPFILGFIEEGERCTACKEHCGVEDLIEMRHQEIENQQYKYGEK